MVAPVQGDSIVPPPALNGGLYNGNPFRAGAPWANVPARPTAASLAQRTLSGAHPPMQARYQAAAMHRPGNNTDDAYEGIDRDTFARIGLPCFRCVDPPSTTTCRYTTINP